MKWLTWQHIGVDRMACAWLIRRYLDPKAEFIFVPAGSKDWPKGVIPFDIPGEKLSHYRGHCTFHTLLRNHKLTDPCLLRIAEIVDEADIVDEVMVEPVAPGLDFICRGIRLVSIDDHEALERGLLVYDALYAQLKTSSK